MERIKEIMKSNAMTRKIYANIKKDVKKIEKKHKLHYHGTFINRSHQYDQLCIILAGYKEFLFDSVFSRIKKYIPRNIDVCVVTSGKYSDKLAMLCEANQWSYLSTKENDVNLVQNVAINLHPKAQYIYKLDEDIFVCKSFFERMMSAYKHALEGDYIPGVIAPLLLVNGFASLQILKKLDLVDEYIARFGSLKHAAGTNQLIENNDNTARFMWGEYGIVPSIDDLNEQFGQEPMKETPCPIRFSIGAILFERNLWEEMAMFDVKRNDKHMMGKDEVKLCQYCMINSKPIMISENIVAGHFSFGKQTEGMKHFYYEHSDKFRIKE